MNQLKVLSYPKPICLMYNFNSYHNFDQPWLVWIETCLVFSVNSSRELCTASAWVMVIVSGHDSYVPIGSGADCLATWAETGYISPSLHYMGLCFDYKLEIILMPSPYGKYTYY